MPSVYLKNLALEEAQKKLFDHCRLHVKSENVPVKDSLHKTTAKAVQAKVSSPSYNASAMDGVAVSASLTEEATESNPITLKKPDFKYLNTGNPVEDPYDAVIKIEDLIERDEHAITIIKAASPYQHIRPIGEDIVEKTTIVPKHHTIRSVDIAAMMAGGVGDVEILKQPSVAFIPTGDEIVRDPDKLTTGKLLDSNSYYIENALQELGLSPTVHDIVKDDIEALEEVILKAKERYDLVLVGAGSSAGSKDFVKTVVEKNGEVIVHGVAIKPGKPTLIGKIDNTPIIGLPGYPVSTFIAFQLFVKPLILDATKHNHPLPETIKAVLTKQLYASLDSEEFVRVRLNNVQNRLTATPLPRGAGMTMSIVQADGLFIVPKDKEGFKANEEGDVILLKPLNDIKRTLSIIGSHDILIDEIDDLMRDEGYTVSSNHVGSLGGVMAIKEHECHLAPVHMLDQYGNYNKHLIDTYLDNDFTLIRGVGRVQGLYTKPGNPKNIQGVEDLSGDVRFVNRQKGSGTRLFLDHLLREKNIVPASITGYDNIVPTHTMVASAVKNGEFDAGLGIQSVANLYDLPFIKIGVERYDFLVHKQSLKHGHVKRFIEVLKSTAFKERLEAIGGYTFENCGDILAKEG